MAVVLVTSALVLLYLEYGAIRPAFDVPRTARTAEHLAPWAIKCFAAYFLFPAFVTVLVLRVRLRDIGLSFAGVGRHLPLYLLLYLLVFPLVWFASLQPAFLNTYPFAVDSGDSLAALVKWELFYGLQFFSLEFFFRGFMIFGLKERFGINAVFVMVVPYCMLHFHKPWMEAAGAIGAGLVLGVLAYRTRSVLGGVLIHWAVAITMDVMAIQAAGGFR